MIMIETNLQPAPVSAEPVYTDTSVLSSIGLLIPVYSFFNITNTVPLV